MQCIDGSLSSCVCCANLVAREFHPLYRFNPFLYLFELCELYFTFAVRTLGLKKKNAGTPKSNYQASAELPPNRPVESASRIGSISSLLINNY